MPIIKSAKKALRQSLKRKKHNQSYNLKMRGLLKQARTLAGEQKSDEAKKLLPNIYKALDKAAKVGVIKKNEASRKKSRITKLLAKQPAKGPAKKTKKSK
jgi:small subunit ribosomal protein S20